MNAAAWFAVGFIAAFAILLLGVAVETFIDRAGRLADQGGPK